MKQVKAEDLVTALNAWMLQNELGIRFSIKQSVFSRLIVIAFDENDEELDKNEFIKVLNTNLKDLGIDKVTYNEDQTKFWHTMIK